MLTKNQQLLIQYLSSIGTPEVSGMYIVALLMEDGKAEEMLDYLCETEEQDWTKLSSIALKISRNENVENG